MLHIAILAEDMRGAVSLEKVLRCAAANEEMEVCLASFFRERLYEEMLKGDSFDLVMIRLEHCKLIPAAQRIRNLDERVLIVICTESNLGLLGLLKYNIFEVLPCPVPIGTAESLLRQVRVVLRGRNYYFLCTCNKGRSKLPCCEILYFESRERRIHIYLCSGETVRVPGKMDEVEIRLKQGTTQFMRIHQSYLVNYRYIRTEYGAFVVMSNGVRLPVSKDRRREFHMRYMQYLSEECTL